MNSLKHGLTARTLVLRDEDPAEFELLYSSLLLEWRPQTALEHELVNRMATQLWRLSRVLPFESAIIEARCADIKPEQAETEEEFFARKMAEVRGLFSEWPNANPSAPLFAT
jgi:hypothetical protein